MTTLYQLPPNPGMPVSASPYCAKLELYFRLTGHPFTSAEGQIFKSPTKSVPYVMWADGTLQGDSGDIIRRLESEGAGLDADLGAEARAEGERAEALAQDILYYSCLYAVFVDPEGWAIQGPAVKAALPWFLRPFLPGIIRGSQRKKCAANGFADRSGHAAAVDALETVSGILGDRPFLLGDEPHVADCAVWANVLANTLVPISTPVREAARADARLQAYLDRLAARAELTLPTR